MTTVQALPLHLRSTFSFHRGVLSVPEICNLALKEGAFAVGLADVNSFAALPLFLAEAGRRGLKALAGVEIRVDRRHLLSLYCLNREGFHRANRLLTALSCSSSPGAPCDPEPFDPVAFLVRDGCSGLAVVALERGAMLQLRKSGHFEPGRGALLFRGLVWGRPFRRELLEARKLGIPLLALNLAVLRGPEDLPFYRLLRALGRRQLLDRLDPPVEYRRDMRIATSREMAAFFSAVPEALEAGCHLAEIAEPFSFPVPSIFPPFQGLSHAEAFQKLSSLAREGLFRRYGPDPGAEAFRRLEYELSIIRDKCFSTIFLLVQDLVLRHPRTCGRGSAAASIVSYSLGITHVDPLSLDLYFERFLNRGRQDPPDIDVDFPWDERESALDYLFESYPGRAALVADHVTYGPRASIREVLRVMALEPEEADRIASLWREEDRGQIPPSLAPLVASLRGLPRHFGTHPGGVVITPGPLTDHVHWFRSPLGRPVAAWEKDGCEAMGLVKIDFLGNRSLGVLRDAIELVNPLRREKGEPEIRWESFSPLDDGPTEQMIRSGDTLGVFYVESPATRQLLQKMGRGDFIHLVAASSIIRPAANRQAETYIRRLRGEGWKSFSGGVGRLLKENLGILIYQEDVSRVAVAAAGFDDARADRLRKVLSKKDRDLHIPAFREEFFSGGMARGMPAAELETLWEGILSFQGYSFCKAHSASYALVSYRLAWMKRHYPLRFFLAVLNNGGGFYAPQVYLDAVRRAGFTLYPPDVNRSGSRFSLVPPDGGAVEGSSGGSGSGASEKEALLGGLSLIRGLSGTVENTILESRRERGPFSSFTDFMDRVAPDAISLRGLIRSGALDSFAPGGGRPALFWDAAVRGRGIPGSGSGSGSGSGGAGRELLLFPPPPPPSFLGDYPETVKLEDELRFLGLFFSCHPLGPFLERARLLVQRLARESGRSLKLVSSGTMEGFSGASVAIAAYLTAGKQLRTRKELDMAFLSFQDPQGLFEGVLFPAAFSRFGRMIDQGEAFLLVGTVRCEWGTFHLEIGEMYPLFRWRQMKGGR